GIDPLVPRPVHVGGHTRGPVHGRNGRDPLVGPAPGVPVPVVDPQVAVGLIRKAVDPAVPRPVHVGDDPPVPVHGRAGLRPLVGPMPGRPVPVVAPQVAVAFPHEGVDPAVACPVHVGGNPRAALYGRAGGNTLVGPVPGGAVPVVDGQVAVGLADEG